MKKSYVLGASLLTGVIVATTMSASVLAWHPEGQIKKYVQNQDANTVQTAVSAKPGDVLKYTVEVSNVGQASNDGYNDMHYTVLTDTLPAGVELVSNPAQRQITENLGVLKPGQKVTKEYLVRVTSKTDKDVITNKACFTGDSEVKDNKQSGCDPAVVTVTVPEEPETPEEPKTPEQPAKGADPQVLPATGPASVATIFTGTTGLGYAAHRLFGRKRQ
jgi:uncharacterized repeat protein (TIGR01451 family)